MFNPCVIVPIYNHGQALPRTLASIRQSGLPVIMVDDGSDPSCKAVLRQLASQGEDRHLFTRPANGGKGAAVKDGMIEALKMGFTHGLQMDADGQHNCEDIPRFLSAAGRQPDALIVGTPRFDQSIPATRYYSRYLTHVWVWINTLSFDIRDSMCGFRVYPLETSVHLIATASMGDRMDFDTEFLVRWHWRGLPMVQLETAVIYPLDGVSHFLPWRDNILISWMHTRLFFGMLWRLPRLLLKRTARKSP